MINFRSQLITNAQFPKAEFSFIFQFKNIDFSGNYILRQATKNILLPKTTESRSPAVLTLSLQMFIPGIFPGETSTFFAKVNKLKLWNREILLHAVAWREREHTHFSESELNGNNTERDDCKLKSRPTFQPRLCRALLLWFHGNNWQSNTESDRVHV